MIPLTKQFEERCRQLYPSLYRTAMRVVGDREVAEDVLQEALVKAYQALDKLHNWDHLAGWLQRITVREAMAALRVKKLWRGRNIKLEENMVAGKSDPVEETELREQQHMIWQQLDLLSPRQRTAFILCAVEERSIRDAADCMGISEGAVKQHLQRGREKLRRKLTKFLAYDGGK